MAVTQVKLSKRDKQIRAYAAQCEMRVFGGINFLDEKPELDKTDRPHLGIVFPDGTISVFKITSVDPRQKSARWAKMMYPLQDPEAVELDHTFHALLNDDPRYERKTCCSVNLSSTVKMFCDDTPPMRLFKRAHDRHWYNQSKFDLSERDKVGLIRKMLDVLPDIRHHQCGANDYQKATPKLKEEMNYHPYCLNVLPELKNQLSLDGLNSKQEMER